MTAEIQENNDLSQVLISLLKGVLYRDENSLLWSSLLDLQAYIRDYIRVIGLKLEIYEDEGFAFLRSVPQDENEPGLPSLIVKRQLSYPVSLLLALLRRRLAEHDASTSESRLILDKKEIIDMVKTFLPEGTNEAKIMDQIETHINKTIELGFIRRLKSGDGKYEIRRILKAFIDAQWLSEFEKKLGEYINSKFEPGNPMEEE
ncbi:MAG: DUF4194 domain-containing protein [Spirochaetes bacterium]|nr:DUF4194 domain-containing protein [Spirochaetota bacterium]